MRTRLALLILFLGAGAALAPAGAAAAPAKVPCMAAGMGKFNCQWRVPGNGIGGGSPVLDSAGRRVGYLHQGTNYITCQAVGRTERDGKYFNNTWGRTVADNHKAGWVNAVWAHGGDNNGGFANVPRCTKGTPPQTTHPTSPPSTTPPVTPPASTKAPAPVPCSPTSRKRKKFNCGWRVPGNGKRAGSPVLDSGGNLVGYLHKGTNYVLCQRIGRSETDGQYVNHWWAFTVADNHKRGWVSALWASGGANNGKFRGVPGCSRKLGSPPTTGKSLTPPTIPNPGPAPALRHGSGANLAGVTWDHTPNSYGYVATVDLKHAKTRDGGFVSEGLWVATNKGAGQIGQENGPFIAAGITQGCGGSNFNFPHKKNVRNVRGNHRALFIAQRDTKGRFYQACFHMARVSEKGPLKVKIKAPVAYYGPWEVQFTDQGDPPRLDFPDAGPSPDQTFSAYAGIESSSQANSASGAVSHLAWYPGADIRDGGGFVPIGIWEVGPNQHSHLLNTSRGESHWKKSGRFSKYVAATNAFHHASPPKPRYVALGDSYNSGEGAGSYLPGTGFNPAGCHRSRNSYAVGLASRFASRFRFDTTRDFLSCSGATIPGGTYPPSLNAQISHMQPHYPEGAPEPIGLVTVGIGGNDVDFAGVVKYCALTRHRPGAADRCQKRIDASFTRAQVDLASNLRASYESIKAQAGAGAQIVAVGYPHLFAKNNSRCVRSLLSPSQRASMNRGANRLDALIHGVASQQGLRFADPRPAFEGHGLCSARKDEWIRSAAAGAGGKKRLQQPLHPNRAGQRALERVIAAQVR